MSQPFKAPLACKQLFSYSTIVNRPLMVDNPVGRMPDPPVDQGYFDNTIPLPLWKIPITVDPRINEDFRFHRKSDPNQANDLWERQMGERDRLLAHMRTMLADESAPREQFDRLGL